MTNPISCIDAISRLQAYLDSELGAVSEAEIDHHLEHCRECFSRAEFEKMLRKRVSETDSEKAPEAVRARIQDILKKF